MFKLIKTISVLWLCLASTFINAQSVNGKITGTVMDETGRPVNDATVSLYRSIDSSTIKYELTDSNGIFNFISLEQGQYYILISSIGKLPYRSDSFEISVLNQWIKLPVITLHPVIKVLNEVVITQKKVLLEHTIDRTIINVDALISNAGTNALEVLEKTPGVSVGEGGNISLHGKPGVAIYIDDKPAYLSGNDLENYLRSLPAATLSKIELMTNPPAKYSAAGTGGIINIKTKKNKATGFNLGASLSTRVSRFTGTNNSFDFNYRKNKVNVFGNFAYTVGNGFSDVGIKRQYLDSTGQTSGAFNQHSFIHTISTGYNAKLGVDVYATENTTLGVLLNGNMRSPHENNKSEGQLFDKSGLIDSSIISNNNELGKFKNGSINVNYKHTFKKEGPEITANLDYLGFATNKDQVFINQTSNNNGAQIVNEQLNGNLPAAIRIYSGNFDYSLPIAAGWKFESGAKGSYTKTDNQSTYSYTVAGNTVIDNDKTNHFLYKESIAAGYLNLNRDFKRLSIQGGLRLELTDSRGHQLGNAQKPDSAFNRSYTSAFPTLYLLYKLDTLGNHQLTLNYGRRIERPYYQDLNPFISPLDKYTFYTGNPYLLPSYSGNVELSYIYKDRISATLSYLNIRDRVTETIEIRNRYYYSRPGNISSTKLYDLNLDAGFEPARWFTLQLSGDVWYLHSKSHFYTGELNNQSINFSLQSVFQFKLKAGWSIETVGKYQGKQSDAQFKLAAKGRINLAVSKIFSPKVTLKLSMSDLLNTYINSGAIDNLNQTSASFRTVGDTRSALLTLSMRFGKSVEGQRKHNQTSAGEENGRVKN